MKKASGVPAPNYTQIPNLLIDLMPFMETTELRVTMAIARETFGWHRPDTRLSRSDLKVKTGLSHHGVDTGLAAGISRGTIGREQIGENHREGYRYFLIIETDSQSSQITDSVNLLAISDGKALPSEMARLVPSDGKPSLLEKENIKENIKETHTHKVTVPAEARENSPDVCVCASRFSLEECLSYARSQKGVTNPEGLARSIYKTGEADELIKIWKDQSAAPVDPSVCPDCNGRGMIYIDPTDMSRGVRKCKHPQLVGATA